MTLTDEVKLRAMNELGVDEKLADRIVEFIEQERRHVAWACLEIAQKHCYGGYCAEKIYEEFDFL